MLVRGLILSLAGMLVATVVARDLTSAQVAQDTMRVDLRGGSSTLCPDPGQYDTSRPDPPDTPTRVSVTVVINDIERIDDVNQSFTADLNLGIRWRDPRLADPDREDVIAVCALPLGEQVWAPVLELKGARQVNDLYKRIILVDADGFVMQRRRLHLTIAHPLDLADFPFDRHDFVVDVHPVLSGLDEIVLEVLGAEIERPLSLSGWTIGEPNAVIVTHPERRLGIITSIYRMTFEARREAGFFLLKALSPLLLIVMMSWLVFWLDPHNVGAQLGIAATSMLTLIASQFAFSSLLPRISYLTRADRFTMAASVLVFAAVVEAAITSSLVRTGREDLATRIDAYCRWAFPIAFAVIIASALWF